jgi:TRAP-type mannitol/chloroaromatic compound transport system substrate-binding protein
VQQGTVECCHTCSYYYVGKDKTFGFGTSIPFGMNARQMNAWIYYGGGKSCSTSSMPTTTFFPSPAVIPAFRWVAGSARN